jgi:methyl-accepting chemotaxis protein
VKIAEQSGHLLQTLVPSIDTTAHLMKVRRRHVERPVVGRRTAQQAMLNLNDVTQQNAAAAESCRAPRRRWQRKRRACCSL